MLMNKYSQKNLTHLPLKIQKAAKRNLFRFVLLQTNKLVHLQDQAVSCNDVTLCNAGVLDLWTAIACKIQFVTVKCCNQSNEGPF